MFWFLQGVRLPAYGILNGAPTQSRGLATQCVGRDTDHTWKETCLILDLTDNTTKHGLLAPSTLEETVLDASPCEDDEALKKP